MKTVDEKCFAFAQSWLGNGYTYSGDTQRLAELVQDISEEFSNQLDQEVKDHVDR